MSNPPKQTPEAIASHSPALEKPADVPKARSPLPKLIVAAILISGACYGTYAFMRSYHYQSTDDAFVQGRITNISPKVSNQVVELDVNDNQIVKAGDILLKLDPRDYQAAIDEAQANVVKAQKDMERMTQLAHSQSISQADMDSDIGNLGVTQARLTQAKLNLEYATIRAPVPGRITRRTVENGNYVQAGQTLLSIVQPDLWVIANFKETQLEKMQVGQKVTLYVDALGLTLKGHVDSFQPGTGSEFSLLPAENATGNYVKVVQRVPVKILFDEPIDTLEKLSPGLSVQPEVAVQ